MHELITNLIVGAVGLAATFVFLKYVKPWMQKTIDTEDEKLTYYKAKKMVQIAHDLLNSYMQMKPSVGLKVIDEVIDTFMEVCDITDKDVAKRVLTSAYADISKEIPKKK